jgi:PilZ domain
MEQIRRRLPRQFTDWRGRYLVEDDPNDRWRGCRVIDISTAGAGLELLETSADEVTGHRIVLAVLLRGELRNVGPSKNNGLRVGIQFTDLTEPERAYLDSLTEIQALW